MTYLCQAHFPNQSVVKIDDGGECLEEGDGSGYFKILLWICPNQTGIFPKQRENCSGNLSSNHLKPCLHFTSDENPTVTVVDDTMVIVVVTVVPVLVLVIILLLMGGFMCWKWKAVKTFAKQHCLCASKCR